MKCGQMLLGARTSNLWGNSGIWKEAEIGNEMQTFKKSGIVEDVKCLILVCYTLAFYYKQCGQ